LYDEIPGFTSYVTTPDGSLLKLDVENEAETLISNEMPSDPNDPCRLNNIAPVNRLEEGRQPFKKEVQPVQDSVKPQG